MEVLRRYFATNNRGLYAVTRFSTEHGSPNNIADLNYIFINATEIIYISKIIQHNNLLL